MQAADAAQYGQWCCLHMLVGFVDHIHLSWPIAKGMTLQSQRGCITNGVVPSHARDSPKGLMVSPREGTLKVPRLQGPLAGVGFAAGH